MKPAAVPLALPFPAAARPAPPALPAPHAGSGLWLALVFPELPLAALGRAGPDAPPRAVSVHQGRRPSLLAVDRAARAAGVARGMGVAAATALCPALHVGRHDPQAEEAALQGLAAWACGYSSRVSLQPPRGLLLEIGASLRLFGGLGPLLQRLRADLHVMAQAAVRAVAPTPEAAWLLARAGGHAPVVAPGRLAGALRPIPVACLELPPAAAQDLEAMGVRTVGECMRLPRDGLGLRLGPELVQRLDRMLGRRPDPRPCWTPPPRFERRLELAGESADRGLLIAAAGQLCLELAGFLCARGCGATAIEIQLAHRGVPATRLSLELVSACRDPHHLQALLAERLERIAIEREVLYLAMRVQRLLPLAPMTADLHAGAGREPPGDTLRGAELLVERLGARLGRDAVRALAARADHRPERASAEPPWHLAAAGPRSPREQAQHPVVPAGMPLWLLPRPRPLGGGAAPDGPLTLEHGPRRIESGWWDGGDVARDYYVARSSRGTRYWIFRERREPRRWFVHGLFA